MLDTPTKILQEFDALSAETSVSLPDLLRKLLATGQTIYGPEWATTWRERCLQGAAPLNACYDFEWIDASEARQVIAQWLNPEAQNGKIFLPFAKTGAGDMYCLVPMSELAVGVALIWHDDEVSPINYRSFDDFITVRFLETFSNLDHLSDDFTEEEILQCVLSDVDFVSQLMSSERQNYLRAFCDLPFTLREFRDGPKSQPQKVLSFISQHQLAIELAQFPAPEMSPLKIVAPWEINQPTEEAEPVKLDPKPVADWRTYALNPKQKLTAIQDYRQQFNVSLSEAMMAVNRYIEDVTKQS